MHSPKGRRAALQNEPAIPLQTEVETTSPWNSRQTEVDLFVLWLSEWREMMDEEFALSPQKETSQCRNASERDPRRIR